MKHPIYIISLAGILLSVSCKKPKPGGGGTVLSSNKSITSFVFKVADNAGLTTDIAGVISADSVVVTVPYGTSLAALKPTVQHNGVLLTPVSGAAQNFSSPVTYVVKAQDGSTKSYIAVVKIHIKSTVYAGSTDGKLYALDGDDGTLKWTYSTGGPINNTSPAYYNGTVFIASSDAYIHAVDAVTGAFKWKYSARGPLVSNGTPVMNNGILYFGTGTLSPLYLIALNASTATLVWEKFNPSFLSCPTWYNGMIHVGGIYGLHAYNAADGNTAFAYNNAISPGNPAAINNVLYAGTEGTVITAYNATTGAVNWFYQDVAGGSPTGGSGGSPTLYNGTVYNTGNTRSMYAVDAASGAFRWKFYAGPNTGYLSSPAAANGIIYTVNTTGHLYALDAITGIERWNYNDGTSAPHTPQNIHNCTVKNDLVYYGSYTKKIYALNALTGAFKWQYTTGGDIFGGPLIVAQDGSVYHPGNSGEQQ